MIAHALFLLAVAAAPAPVRASAPTPAPAPAAAPAPSPAPGQAPAPGTAAAPATTAPAAGTPDEPTRYTFTGLDIEGELRTPALLQFLARIGGEFETSGIPHRSFIPELRATIAEDAL